MKKKGQFFLITAIVLVGLFIGLATVINSYKKTETTKTQEIEENFKIERQKILDYIAIQNLEKNEANNFVDNFAKDFREFWGEDKNLLIIFGDSGSLNIVGRRIENTTIYYNAGGDDQSIQNIGDFELNISPTSNIFILKIDNHEYDFNLQDGQNIYYLVKYNYNEEVHIIHG